LLSGFRFFSGLQYKQKESHFEKVYSCFRFQNANKNKTLSVESFKAVLSANVNILFQYLQKDLMRERSQLKTPCEYPLSCSIRAVGLIAVSFSFCFIYCLTQKNNKISTTLYFVNFRVMSSNKFTVQNLFNAFLYHHYDIEMHYWKCENFRQYRRRFLLLRERKDTRYVSLADESKHYYYFYSLALSLKLHEPYDEMSRGEGRVEQRQRSPSRMNNNGFLGAKPGNTLHLILFYQIKSN
jgi:hypothetical protein